MKSALKIAALAAAGALCAASAGAQQGQVVDTTKKLVLTGKIVMYEPQVPNSGIFVEVAGVDDNGDAKKRAR